MTAKAERRYRVAHDGIRFRLSIKFEGQGRTHQEFKDECDVNLIIPKYDRTGLLNHINEATAQYDDYSEVNEYQENLNFVIQARDNFMKLPSNIRKMFGNDAGMFFEFATDLCNKEKMIELGLALPSDRTPREEAHRASEQKSSQDDKKATSGDEK